MTPTEKTSLQASTTASHDDLVAMSKPKPISISQRFAALQKQMGFQQTSNFIYFLLTAGFFFVFCVVRTNSLSHKKWLERAFMHGFWYKDGVLALSMKLHLRSVIPSGLIMPIQFIPAIRQKHPKFHTYVGRLNLTLLMIGNITAIMVAPRAFGGGIETQILVWVLAFFTTYSTYRSWVGIRNLRIDVHRTWILRTWAYAGAILTMRICIVLFSIGVHKVSANKYRSVTTCQELLYLYEATNSSTVAAYAKYPMCANVTSAMRTEPMVDVTVTPAFGGGVEQVVAMLNMIFGVSGWVALVLHAAAVEIYLNATKDEDARLKKVSALRRKAAGMEDAGK